MKILLLALVFLYLSSEATSLRHFRFGRKLGGNLGSPDGHTKVAFDDDPDDDDPTLWFTQYLDHFNPTDETTWQQRYYASDEFYDPKLGGPVFLLLGGEGAISPSWMSRGSWITTAKRHGALLFQLEHRFYGESQPTEDLSNENIRYLTSEQALADAATFIEAMNKKYELPSDVKWISFGGSYSGSLAAWLRFKYPHLVHGAMSSSGPLLAQVDFKNYLKIVGESLGTYSDECVSTVKDSFHSIGVLLKQAIGQDNLNNMFKSCLPLQNATPLDIEGFYQVIADNFAGVVQYNKDNVGGSTANITIDVVCAIMVDEEVGVPLERLAAVNQLLLDAYEEDCLDYSYDESIYYYQNASLDSDGVQAGWRQWLYQTCSEFGFYQTSSDDQHVFGDQFPIDYFIQTCVDVFGDAFDADFLDAAIDRTNVIYGGLDIETSNVVFVHGSIDPWHALGVIETRNVAAPAIFIEGTAHCANMYPPGPNDPPGLDDARQQVDDLIDIWLGFFEK